MPPKKKSKIKPYQDLSYYTDAFVEKARERVRESPLHKLRKLKETSRYATDKA